MCVCVECVFVYLVQKLTNRIATYTLIYLFLSFVLEGRKRQQPAASSGNVLVEWILANRIVHLHSNTLHTYTHFDWAFNYHGIISLIVFATLYKQVDKIIHLYRWHFTCWCRRHFLMVTLCHCLSFFYRSAVQSTEVHVIFKQWKKKNRFITTFQLAIVQIFHFSFQ